MFRNVQKHRTRNQAAYFIRFTTNQKSQILRAMREHVCICSAFLQDAMNWISIKRRSVYLSQAHGYWPIDIPDFHPQLYK